MVDRINCCVPFCKRTRHNRDNTSEWICAVHWPTCPTHLKRRKYKLFRMYKRRFGSNGYWAYPAGSPNRIAAVKLDKLCNLAWERCKRAIIERAAGL